jgi:hypothetical protein
LIEIEPGSRAASVIEFAEGVDPAKVPARAPRKPWTQQSEGERLATLNRFGMDQLRKIIRHGSRDFGGDIKEARLVKEAAVDMLKIVVRVHEGDLAQRRFDRLPELLEKMAKAGTIDVAE